MTKGFLLMTTTGRPVGAFRSDQHRKSSRSVCIPLALCFRATKPHRVACLFFAAIQIQTRSATRWYLHYVSSTLGNYSVVVGDEEIFPVSWLLFANRSREDRLNRIRVPIFIGVSSLFFTRLSSVRSEISSAAAAGFLPIKTLSSWVAINFPHELISVRAKVMVCSSKQSIVSTITTIET
jgi:hypothetical protein